MKRISSLMWILLCLAVMPGHRIQAAVPEVSLAVPTSMQAELLNIKQSPIFCSDAVLRIAIENSQFNRSSSSEPTEDASSICIHSRNIGSELMRAGSIARFSILTAPLFLNHCNWRL